MAEVVFSPRAAVDIDRIYDWTEASWGFHHADEYTNELRSACLGLARKPRLGTSISHIRKTYFRLICGSHNIFFRQEPYRIVVIRILHNWMDPARHL
jgi:toxin ParE1/3/4